jgi:hypothetical protein
MLWKKKSTAEKRASRPLIIDSLMLKKRRSMAWPWRMFIQETVIGPDVRWERKEIDRYMLDNKERLKVWQGPSEELRARILDFWCSRKVSEN